MAVYGDDTYDNGSTSNTVTETVVAKATITTTSLPNATRNTTYSQSLSVSVDQPPLHVGNWLVTAGVVIQCINCRYQREANDQWHL